MEPIRRVQVSRLCHKTAQTSQIILSECNVRKPTPVDPVVVGQRKMDIAKQENIR